MNNSNNTVEILGLEEFYDTFPLGNGDVSIEGSGDNSDIIIEIDDITGTDFPVEDELFNQLGVLVVISENDRVTVFFATDSLDEFTASINKLKDK